jgi:hypothetical protein
MMDDADKIYKKHKHEKVEPATITVDRFTLDDKPTCMSWYGSETHERMACRFLMTSRFGTRYHCGISGYRLPEDLSPTEHCPLWGDT